MPVACQSRGVTEPQRDAGERSETERVSPHTNALSKANVGHAYMRAAREAVSQSRAQRNKKKSLPLWGARSVRRGSE